MKRISVIAQNTSVRQKNVSNRSASKSTVRIPIKIGPADWSRDELHDRASKFGQFDLNKSTGKASFIVVNKRIFGDVLNTIKELFRRYNEELIHISFKSCFLTDEILSQMLDSVKSLNNLETFAVNGNILTKLSVLLVISKFSYPASKIVSVDMRDNPLDEVDGQLLYGSFSSIKELNGIQIGDMKNILNGNLVALENRNLKLTDISILFQSLKDCSHINTVNIAKNNVNAKCLKIIADFIKEKSTLTHLDISYNPVISADDGIDFDGVDSLLLAVKTTTSICSLNVTGCKLPVAIVEQLECSAQVNRSLRGAQQGNYFNGYIENIARLRGLPPPRDPLQTWTPSLRVDVPFVVRNKLLSYGVVHVQGDSITLPFLTEDR